MTKRYHPYVGTRTYYCWSAMIQRCHNPKNPGYRIYGARGISVCSQWKKSFVAFLNDMGECPSADHSIDRINNNQGYRKSNCRWATRKEQSRNTRKNIYITFNGETLILKDWASRLGIRDIVLKARLKNWPLEKAMTTGSRSSVERYRDTTKSRLLTYNGETRTLTEWARALGMSKGCLQNRLQLGTVEEAIGTPFQKGKRLFKPKINNQKPSEG